MTNRNNIYLLAHGFPEGTGVDQYVKHITKECADHGITGEASKMGTHMTAITPFYCDEETIHFAASLMKVLGAFNIESSITVSGIGYFPPPNNESNIEAMHLKIQLPEKYYEYVTWLKATKSFDWVHTPTQTTAVEPIYVPHVHIIEGVDLIKKTKPFIEELDRLVSGRTFKLPAPQFFIKDETLGVWKQIIL